MAVVEQAPVMNLLGTWCALRGAFGVVVTNAGDENVARAEREAEHSPHGASLVAVQVEFGSLYWVGPSHVLQGVHSCVGLVALVCWHSLEMYWPAGQGSQSMQIPLQVLGWA
eukprot:363140-Hanusia_phi.AAC.2